MAQPLPVKTASPAPRVELPRAGAASARRVQLVSLPQRMRPQSVCLAEQELGPRTLKVVGRRIQ